VRAPDAPIYTVRWYVVEHVRVMNFSHELPMIKGFLFREFFFLVDRFAIQSFEPS
jgi:hypothetical protein